MTDQSAKKAGQYYSGKLDRRDVIQLLATARRNQSYRFGRQTAMIWLANFPGDLEVRVELGMTFLAERKFHQAKSILESVVLHDPEYIQAYMGLNDVYVAMGSDLIVDNLGIIMGLGGQPFVTEVPEWAKTMAIIRGLAKDSNYADAEDLVHQLLENHGHSIHVALLHLWVNYCEKDFTSAYTLANVYRERWQDCIQFNLIKAESLFSEGNDQQAITLVHRCASLDIGGQVARRWWGEDHPYRPLWPGNPEIFFDLPIPAEIAGEYGWNLLQPGEESLSSSVSSTPPELSQNGDERKETIGKSINSASRRKKAPSEITQEVGKEMDAISQRMKQPSITRLDGRFPIYVVLSNKTRLQERYGEETFQMLDNAMQGLAAVIRARKGWGARVVYADEQVFVNAEGVAEPVKAGDPWSIKLYLADLDEQLEKTGERIGSVLLVGDDGILPYHRLPNPIDDLDDEVLSDNPYATLDSNYFIPEWMVGRLPGEAGSDPRILLGQIRSATSYHESRTQQAKRSKSFKYDMTEWMSLIRKIFSRSSIQKSFGYSASVWKRPSHAAFRPIGEGRNLQQSPPSESGKLKSKEYIQAPLGYYNLHGVADAGEWFGQKDVHDTSSGPDYPVAFRPDDLKKNGSHPQIVFSEACYGAFVEGKTDRDSIALRFISLGTHAVVGSTCTSYGSIGLPLVGADLLANLFWKYIREGYVCGEALMLAKMNLAREMTRRQGYLDGEDQKTLISFTLLGDPLAAWDTVNRSSKGVIRYRNHQKVKTVSDQSLVPIESNAQAEQMVPHHVINGIKSVVEPYLPGIQQAELDILQSRHVDSGGDSLVEKNLRSRAKTGKTGKTLLIFRKQVMIDQHQTTAYARITLDSEGKIIKSVVSR